MRDRATSWLSMWIVALCVSAACSRARSRGDAGDASGPVVDASTPDATGGHDASDRDASLTPPLCPWAAVEANCGPSEFNLLEERVSASHFGGDARFVAADGDFLLVARDSDLDLLVAAIPSANGGATTVEQWALPAGWRAIDVQEMNSDRFVLACDDNDCRLLRLDHDSNELEDEALSMFPNTFEPRGLVFGLYSIQRGPSAIAFPCVYGRGMLCFDGTQWRTELADEPLMSATLTSQQAVLTSDGRVLLRANNASAWTAVNDLTVNAPRWIDAVGVDRVGLQADPTTWAWIDSAGNVSRCNLGASYTALRSVTSNTIFGVQNTGTAFSFFDWGIGRQDCWTHETTAASIVELTVSTCGIIYNVRHLTPTTLSSTEGCGFD